MTTPIVPLSELARRIAQQQSELETLRLEYESRQSQMTDLLRKKQELETQLRQVDASIAAIMHGTALPPISRKPVVGMEAISLALRVPSTAQAPQRPARPEIAAPSARATPAPMTRTTPPPTPTPIARAPTREPIPAPRPAPTETPASQRPTLPDTIAPSARPVSPEPAPPVVRPPMIAPPQTPATSVEAAAPVIRAPLPEPTSAPIEHAAPVMRSPAPESAPPRPAIVEPVAAAPMRPLIVEERPIESPTPSKSGPQIVAAKTPSDNRPAPTRPESATWFDWLTAVSQPPQRRPQGGSGERPAPPAPQAPSPPVQRPVENQGAPAIPPPDSRSSFAEGRAAQTQDDVRTVMATTPPRPPAPATSDSGRAALPVPPQRPIAVAGHDSKRSGSALAQPHVQPAKSGPRNGESAPVSAAPLTVTRTPLARSEGTPWFDWLSAGSQPVTARPSMIAQAPSMIAQAPSALQQPATLAAKETGSSKIVVTPITAAPQPVARAAQSSPQAQGKGSKGWVLTDLLDYCYSQAKPGEAKPGEAKPPEADTGKQPPPKAS